MHEFSIVTSIVDIVIDTAAKHNVDKIVSVDVEIGEASGVIKEAMDFAWDAAKKGTIMEEAVLKIISIPVKARCKKCHTVFSSSAIFDVCPSCGDSNPEIISGRELRVTAIETS